VVVRLVEDQDKVVAAIISQAGAIVFIRVFGVSGAIEVLGADVQRLMNVANVMGQQAHRDRLRNFAGILLAFLTLQNPDAKRNHLHDVRGGSAAFAIVVFLIIQNRDIDVVEPAVIRNGAILVQGLWIGLPKCEKLFGQLFVRGQFRQVGRIGRIIVPILNLVRQ